MPRNGSGIFSVPVGTDGVPDTTIESTKYNTFTHDVEADLNAPRPVVAGGTGAVNAHDARANLGAEAANVTITNFDTQVWESGSWGCVGGTTAAPDGGSYTGTSIAGINPDYVTLEAYNASTGTKYIRQKRAGVWGSWEQEAASLSDTDARYVNVTGDTMTGNLTIAPSSGLASVTLSGIAGTSGDIVSLTGGQTRWRMRFSDDFSLFRYNDAGVVIDAPLGVNRSTGVMTLGSDVRTVRPSNTAEGIVTFGSGNAALYMDATNFNVLNAGLKMAGTLRVIAAGATDSASVSQAAVHISFSSNVGTVYRPSADSNYPVYFVNAADTAVGNIQTTTTTTFYTTTSDGALKEDLQPVGVNAAQIISDTEIYDFRWKATGERSYGVVAQQAAPVYSEPFHRDAESDRWFVDYSKYVPILIQEVKDLRREVTELRAQIAAPK